MIRLPPKSTRKESSAASDVYKRQLYVHPGHVGMFEEGVSFEITTIRGVKNVLFGGDGLFLAKLTGPGKVWLQTLTLSKLAHALAPYLPHESK